MPKLDTIIAIKGSGSSTGRRKGLIRPRGSELLGRRRTSPAGKFLRVFDLGELAGGADLGFLLGATDYEFSYSASTGDFGVLGDLDFTSLAPTPEYEAAYNAHVLSFGYEGFPELFREITADLADYDVSVDGAGAYVPGSGLTIPEEVVDLRGSSGLDWDTEGSAFFPDWLDGTGRSVKITATPDYDDDAVTLTVDRSVDVFLSPVLMITTGFARDVPSPFPAFPYLPQTFYYLMARYRALSRSALADPDWQNLWDNRTNFPAITSGGRAYLRDTLIGGSTLLTITPSAPGTVAGGDISVGSAGFPTEDSDTLTAATVQAVGIRQGALMAVVRKHLAGGEFEWYFVWSDDAIWTMPGRAVSDLDV